MAGEADKLRKALEQIDALEETLNEIGVDDRTTDRMVDLKYLITKQLERTERTLLKEFIQLSQLKAA